MASVSGAKLGYQGLAPLRSPGSAALFCKLQYEQDEMEPVVVPPNFMQSTVAAPQYGQP